VIATPGRLLDHVEQKNISLARSQMLVMDEADRMLDMGFLPDLQRIINLLPKKRQNLMFSATFSPEIKKLAASFLTEPLTDRSRAQQCHQRPRSPRSVQGRRRAEARRRRT
jgi:ATP-dependent RNA helicase RhlE